MSAEGASDWSGDIEVLGTLLVSPFEESVSVSVLSSPSGVMMLPGTSTEVGSVCTK